MYFPYLRGRQNELLCLRELLGRDRLSRKIIPVIEPVRCSSTFFSTLSKFIEKDRNVIIIKNSKVGNFEQEYEKLEKEIEKEVDEKKKEKLKNNLNNYKNILKNKHVLHAYICDKGIIVDCLEQRIEVKDSILINLGEENFNYYEDNGEKLKAKVTFIPRNEDFRDEIYGDVVILEDGYFKAKRNSDYIKAPDDFFSRNHLIFKKRGYSGFSDYSIVGKSYEESGFAPLAVAIHITYFGDKNELRVHHFVSRSNENISDPARKFEEAMENMLSWENFEILPHTYGLNCLLDYYKNGKFPGLGVIKKCSLMHHIEMIGDYLERAI